MFPTKYFSLFVKEKTLDTHTQDKGNFRNVFLYILQKQNVFQTSNIKSKVYLT